MELGLAQRLFSQKTGHPLHFFHPKHVNKWILVQSLLERGFFSYIDVAIAQRCVQQSENAVLFVAYLSLISRSGHICIKIQNGELFPNPHDLYDKTENDEGVQLAPLLNELTGRLLQNPLDENIKEIKICHYALCTCYYFLRYWDAETAFLTDLDRLIHAEPLINHNFESIHNQCEEKVHAGKLLPEQAESIIRSCSSSFSLLCGGPGTGKTYTAANLIEMIWNSLTPTQKDSYKIAIAAPTGKAAGNLQKALNAATKDLTGFKPLTAVTIHRLIEINKESKSFSSLDAHLIIIDESSMVDAYVMSELLAYVHSGAQIILIGDPSQLPPVENGAFFKEIVEHREKLQVPISFLNRCLRAELQEIIDFASAINLGDWQRISSCMNKGAIHFNSQLTSLIEPKIAQRLLVDRILTLMSKEMASPYKYFEALQDLCVLTPLRKGFFGVDELNRLIHELRLKEFINSTHYFVPIIIIKNDVKQELYNGDIGLLVVHLPTEAFKGKLRLKEGDFALFSNRFPKDGKDNIRRLSALLLPAWEYAYVMTIHKSQGSEFNSVLLIMPDGAEHFGKEGFYTAVTRTKQNLEIWGSESVLKASISKEDCRISGISERI